MFFNQKIHLPNRLHLRTFTSFVWASVFSILLIPGAGFGQNLIVVRHGESENNLKKIFNSKMSSRPIPMLTPNGISQVKAAAKILKDKGYSASKIFAVYFSPLRRAKQTTEILIQELGVEKSKTREDQALIEGNMGSIEGKTFDDSKSFFPNEDIWNNSRAHEFLGEDSIDISKRVSTFLANLKKLKPKSDVLVITHGIPAKLILDILDKKNNFKDDHHLKNGEVRIVPLLPRD